MIKQQLLKQLLTLSVFLFSVSVYSAAPDFYTIEDSVNFDSANEFKEVTFDPVENVENLAKDLTAQVQQAISLLRWDHHKTTLEDPNEPFDRTRHYGHWLVDRAHGCLDTRAKILIRQSQGPVRLNDQGCRVMTGRWHDPYTNRIYTIANDLDVDHVVPLKNSYDSGAWKWDGPKRCLYANFMANNFQLLSVDKFQNRQKGQKGPDEFMPENQAFSCDYLAIWLKIKLIWSLALSPMEAQGIANLVKQNRCNPARMAMAVSELETQRRSIEADKYLCTRAFSEVAANQ